MGKRPDIRAKFDWMVLKPLWALFIISAIYYFLQKAWLTGFSMIVMAFLLGIVAASLHKEKSFVELSEGQPSFEEAFGNTDTAALTDEELLPVSKSLMKLSPILFIASLILAKHYGLKLSYALGLSAVVAILGPWILAIPFLLQVKGKK